jgi:excinuclease UvrABC ATPase subunit
VACGEMPGILKDAKKHSLTLDYLRGKCFIETPKKRRRVSLENEFLRVKGRIKFNSLE